MFVDHIELITALSISDRNKYYKSAYQFFKKERSKFLCSCIYKAFSEDYYHMEESEALILFPEFLSFRPVGKLNGGPWFEANDKISRELLISKCIEMTSKC